MLQEVQRIPETVSEPILLDVLLLVATGITHNLSVVLMWSLIRQRVHEDTSGVPHTEFCSRSLTHQLGSGQDQKLQILAEPLEGSVSLSNSRGSQVSRA